jgi:hypothetical protein
MKARSGSRSRLSHSGYRLTSQSLPRTSCGSQPQARNCGRGGGSGPRCAPTHSSSTPGGLTNAATSVLGPDGLRYFRAHT